MVMLSPAEELGLSGMGLDSRVRKALYQIPAADMVALERRMTEESARRSLIYLRGGQPETIRVLLRPLGVMPDQLAYLHVVSLTILGALKRLPDMYLEDAEVRKVVPLSEPDEAWLRDTWGASQRENNPVFGRLDGMMEFTSPMWKDSLKFVEPNLCGIGGIHFGPTCEQLLADLVLPVLQAADPHLVMETGTDLRELFIQEVLDHLEAIGRAGKSLCFIEPKYAGEGPDEQEALAEYFHARHGLHVMHADPAELSVREGEVCYHGVPIDIAYRDYEIRDLIALHDRDGVDIEPLKMLFRENRIVSSAAGDFDHKSCWEVLTDPRFKKYFNADERQMFRRHVLWTRVMADRRTTLPDGNSGDLLKFVRSHREMLVLKPNRDYGGHGVTLGHLIAQSEWETAIETAAGGEGSWVVQRLAAIPVHEFPVVDSDGSVHVEPFYTVMGFAPTKFGLGILGRASQKQVVNVAQRGGMCGVLIGKSPARLVGPGGGARGEA